MKRSRRLSKQLGDLEGSTLFLPDDALFGAMSLSLAQSSQSSPRHDEDESHSRKRVSDRLDPAFCSSGDDDDTNDDDDGDEEDEWRVGELPPASKGRPMHLPPLLQSSNSFKENDDTQSVTLSPSPSPRRTLTVSKRRILVCTKFSYERRLPLDKVFLASMGVSAEEAVVTFLVEEEDSARSTVKLSLSA